MRRRIWRISEDRFDDKAPQTDIAPSSINITGYEGQNIEGAFRIISLNKIPVKGFVFSSSPYVVCDRPEFEGTDVTIPFHTESSGFQTGDILSGFFDIVYNQGEKRLPYNFGFEGVPVNTSEGSIKNLDDFVRLCEVNFTEGFNVFYSGTFARFMERQDVPLRLLYKGYNESAHLPQNMENFLVDAGLKDAVIYNLGREKIVYDDFTDDQMDSVSISRNTWGRLCLSVSSDVDFIELTQKSITENDFLGKEFRYDFYIRKDKLHAGKNAGFITFSDGKREKKIEICVRLRDDSEAERKLNHRIHSIETEIYNDLLSFRLGKIDPIVYTKKLYNNLIILHKANESKKKAHDPAVYFDNEGQIHDRTDLSVFDYNNDFSDEEKKDDEEYLSYRLPVFHRLLLCHGRILNKEKQKALWLIRDLKEDINNHNSFEWAYLLYLCIIIDSDEQYQDKLTEEIEKIFRMNPDDYRIFVLLLYLRKEYLNDSARKLKDIRYWISSGYRCPVLLAEAYDIMRNNPYLVQKFDGFTLSVLNFARKRDVLNKDVINQLPSLLSAENTFNPFIFNIVEAGYDKNPNDELLQAIVEYFIRCQKLDKEASVWFKSAIDRSVNVNGLYEAYLNSLPMETIEDVPEQVLIYFRYPNNLPDDRKAFLFVTVISMKWKKPRIYNEYIPYIEEFALQQLQNDRIDENLTVIYQEVLSKNHNYPAFKELLEPFLFIKRIAVLSPEKKQVVLYQNCYRKPVMAPVLKNVAYVPVVDKNYLVFTVDKDGTVSAAEENYSMDSLLKRPDEDEERANADSVPAMLYELTRKEKNYIYTEDEIPFLETILSNNELDPLFLMDIYPDIHELLKRNGREDAFFYYFWSRRDQIRIPSEIIPSVIGYGIRSEHFEEAYEYLKHVNGQNTGRGLALNLINYMIVKYEFKSNDFLITAAAKLMAENFASQQSVSYLSKYFSGATEWMESLLDKCEKESVFNPELAGRILMQLLYTADYSHFPEKAFKIFLSRKPNRMVREAVLTFWAREYILYDTELTPLFFSELLRAYAYDDDVNESMRVALIKYLCGKGNLTEEETILLDRSIRHYMSRNIRFSFFKDAPQGLKIKYHLYDKSYIKFKYEAGKRLYIVTEKKDSDPFTDLLPEAYPGLYIRSYILFSGETMKYEIHADKKDGEIVEEGTLTGQNYFEKGYESRFDRLNHMNYDVVMQENEDLKNQILEYGKLDAITGDMFGIL